MNRPIEEIKGLIKDKKRIIQEEQSKILELKKELCQALTEKFTDDTGIKEGDKFKRRENLGVVGKRRIEHLSYGFFVGFGLNSYGNVVFVYADVKKDGTKSKTIHNREYSSIDFHISEYEKAQD